MGDDLQLARLFNEVVRTLEQGKAFPNLLRASHALAHLLALMIGRLRSKPMQLAWLAAPVVWGTAFAWGAGGAGRPDGRKPAMTAIFNCGFPEAHQNTVALEICRLFAREAGFHWSGGMSMGMGEILGGRSLEQAGRKVRPVLEALNLAALALTQDSDIPEEAVKLMASPIMPKWLYVLGGNWSWRREARRNGLSVEALSARPFE